MATRTDFSSWDCSVARTLEVIGDRWSLLIIRDAFYGLRRFDEFQRDLGIARNVLADRLGKLVEHGVLAKLMYEERPPRYEYELTDKGSDLLGVVLTMMAWGDRWERPDGADRPTDLICTRCDDHDARAEVTCQTCNEPFELGHVRTHPLPVQGARPLERTLTPAD